MTTLKIFGLVMVLGLVSFNASAQSREVPGVSPIIRPGSTALMQYHTVPKFTVIQSGNQQYLISSEGLKHMKADWVTTVKILKDSSSVKPYGIAAAKGVAICVLDDAYHPEAIKTLKPWLTPFKPKNNS
ncbi:hypothetical protein [Mucilaginibacter sp. CSA2-8R]|uniref:hypothetical protein n=1 Tax=Mucilaginibacter sp. CSA2-8R TaxID=3141542 RepID=UPI00315DA038